MYTCIHIYMTLNKNTYYVKFALRAYFTWFIIIFHLDLYKTSYMVIQLASQISSELFILKNITRDLHVHVDNHFRLYIVRCVLSISLFINTIIYISDTFLYNLLSCLVRCVVSQHIFYTKVKYRPHKNPSGGPRKLGKA